MDIISQIAPELNHIIGQLVQWIHSLVPSYGLAVILFTVFLKIITLPMDYWQRYSMRKNMLLQKKLKPFTDQIDRKYAVDPSDSKYQENQRIAASEKQALYKKYGYSLSAGCLPMIIMMAIFLFMFDGFRVYSNYSNTLIYNNLVNTFNTAYTVSLPEEERNEFITQLNAFDAEIAQLNNDIALLEAQLKTAPEAEKPLIQDEIDELSLSLEIKTIQRKDIFDEKNRREKQASEYAAQQVGLAFDNIHEPFLWIKNIYRADSWQSVWPTYSEMSQQLSEAQKVSFTESDYNLIYNAVMEYSETGKGYFDSHWNGLLILPLLSIGLSFLSTIISQRLNRTKDDVVDEQTQKSNRMMMFMMPIMLAFFVFTYTAAFAVYMVSNSFLSILSSIAMTPIINKSAQKKVDADFISREPSYSRNKKDK